MLNLKDYNKHKDIKNFIQKIFEARQIAHNVHLNSKKYSEHIALNEFYDSLLTLADDFIEIFQGQHGLIGDLDFSVSQSGVEIISYLEEFASLTKVSRESLKEAHLQNILDEILSLTYKTIYKLKYLK